jgi:hypothetical protein
MRKDCPSIGLDQPRIKITPTTKITRLIGIPFLARSYPMGYAIHHAVSHERTTTPNSQKKIEDMAASGYNWQPNASQPAFACEVSETYHFAGA